MGDLGTPGVEPADLEAVGREALRLAALDPGEAQALCESVLPRARADRAWGSVCVLERALGLAAMTLSQIDQAVAHLRTAVGAGQRAAQPTVTGEARMSLASALLLRGLPGQASRQIRQAVRELTGVEAARAAVQYGAILQELGHHDEALQQVRRALPVLRRAGDAEWQVRALSNRSLVHAERRAFSTAEADLEAARTLCLRHQLELPIGYVEQNLGYLKAQRGDVAASLRLLDDAAERYRRFGLSEPSLLLDRAGVLLSVRLLDEARASCEEAVAAYAAQRRDVHLPEAHLMLSTVALLQGAHDLARASAVEAERGFRRLGQRHSLVLARYALIQAELQRDRHAVTLQRITRVADDLEAGGWTVPALEARVLAGRQALERGEQTAARRHLSRASRARTVGPADARARAWLAEATLRRADGRRIGALAALRAGLRIVEEHQATLGATELRAHVSVHRGELARTGLRMALEDGDAKGALCWAERGRAIALLLRPATPPDDPQLAQDLTDLRSTMARLEAARAEGSSEHGRLVRRQVLLERRIRDRCRTLQGHDARRPVWTRESVGDLIRALGDAALVEYVEIAGTVQAITVAGGRVAVRVVGPVTEVRDAARRLRFCLHRLARFQAGGSPRPAQAASQGLREAAEHLDGLLVRPLAGLSGRPLVVVPSSATQSLPWSVLPSCAGRPVTICPSALLWSKAVERPAPAQPATVVVAGPGLPGAAQEASAVAGLYRETTVLTGADATAATLTRAAAGASMVHLAAHGNLRSDNPLFSSLLLADGPLTVYDMERASFSPHQVVLAGCDTGRLQEVADAEILGFAGVMLGGGTATLVAPVVPIPDRATLPVMRAYHERLVAGLPPATALARVQSQADPDDAAAATAAAAFICLGAG